MVNRQNNSNPTIDDVARAAGVSTTTVSRVINKIPTVKGRNKSSVLDAVKKLGYVPDSSAQRLAGAKSRTIGLFIPPYEDMFYTFYYSVLIRGVGEAVSNSGCDLLLRLTQPLTDGDLFVQRMFDSKFVRGLLFADIVGNEEVVAMAAKKKVPFVIMNHYSREIKHSCVGFDSKKGATDVMEYLIKLGHKNIAHITGKLFVKAGMDRLDTYKASLKKHGLEFNKKYVVEADWSAKLGKEAMEKLLSVSPRPTAVFVAGDEMAIESIKVAQSAGLKVPQDISIVGFDDVPAASYGEVPLTTVRQPFVEMGRKAVEMLNKMALGNTGKSLKVMMPTEFIERKSCAPPKRS